MDSNEYDENPHLLQGNNNNGYHLFLSPSSFTFQHLLPYPQAQSMILLCKHKQRNSTFFYLHRLTNLQQAHIVRLPSHSVCDPSLLPARAGAPTWTLSPIPIHLLKDSIQQTGSLDFSLFTRSFPSINNMLPTLKHPHLSTTNDICLYVKIS